MWFVEVGNERTSSTMVWWRLTTMFKVLQFKVKVMCQLSFLVVVAFFEGMSGSISNCETWHWSVPVLRNRSWSAGPHHSNRANTFHHLASSDRSLWAFGWSFLPNLGRLATGSVWKVMATCSARNGWRDGGRYQDDMKGWKSHRTSTAKSRKMMYIGIRSKAFLQGSQKRSKLHQTCTFHVVGSKGWPLSTFRWLSSWRLSA